MSTDIDRIGLATADLMADITHEIHDFCPDPISFGGYSDIHTGVWRSTYGEMKVAIKVIRAKQMRPGTDDLPHVLRREIRVWKKLLHPNIHIMCGFYKGRGPAPALVSPWYENGDINNYVLRYAMDPNVGELKLRLFSDIMTGLKFLHDHEIVHGDIKGANVLISDDGVARLCDFGLSCLLLEHSQSITYTGAKGTLRWMAPELILEEGSQQSYASDIWACGCLFIEVWSNVKPYHTKTNDHQVIFALSRWELPARPAEMPNMVWAIVQECCNFDIKQRSLPLQVLANIGMHLKTYRTYGVVTLGRAIDPAAPDLLGERGISMCSINPPAWESATDPTLRCIAPGCTRMFLAHHEIDLHMRTAHAPGVVQETTRFPISPVIPSFGFEVRTSALGKHLRF